MEQLAQQGQGHQEQQGQGHQAQFDSPQCPVCSEPGLGTGGSRDRDSP